MKKEGILIRESKNSRFQSKFSLSLHLIYDSFKKRDKEISFFIKAVPHRSATELRTAPLCTLCVDALIATINPDPQ